MPAVLTSAQRPPDAPGLFSLDAARVGGIYIVERVDLEAADAAMLRAMGLRGGAMIRVCRVGEPTVAEVISGHTCRCQCRCRIGIARGLARRITLKREA
ncbi:MAG: ferrous iron transport protein A [Planctomycetota bacterium]